MSKEEIEYRKKYLAMQFGIDNDILVLLDLPLYCKECDETHDHKQITKLNTRFDYDVPVDESPMEFEQFLFQCNVCKTLSIRERRADDEECQ